jgi:hypothetical protein
MNNTRMRGRAPLLAVVLSLAAGACQAHGLWIAARGGATALVYGDGGEDLDIRPRLPKLRQVQAWGADGAPLPLQLQTEGRLALLQPDGPAVALSATLDNGLWSKDAAGRWHAQGHDERPDAVVSGHYLKTAVHLPRWPQAVVKPLPGLALQLLPADDTQTPLMLGQPIRLRVYLNGRPVVGAQVGQDLPGDPDGQTVQSDAEGVVVLKVRNQGLNVLWAALDTAPADPRRARQTSLLATLSFTLPHAPE